MTQIARKAGRLYTVWISIDLLERVVDLSQDSKDQLHFVIPFLFWLPGIPRSAGTRGKGYGVSNFLTCRRPKDKHKHNNHKKCSKHLHSLLNLYLSVGASVFVILESIELRVRGGSVDGSTTAAAAAGRFILALGLFLRWAIVTRLSLKCEKAHWTKGPRGCTKLSVRIVGFTDLSLSLLSFLCLFANRAAKDFPMAWICLPVNIP